VVVGRGAFYKVTGTLYGYDSPKQVFDRLQRENPLLADHIEQIAQVNREDIAYRYPAEYRENVLGDLVELYTLLEAQAEANKLEEKLG